MKHSTAPEDTHGGDGSATTTSNKKTWINYKEDGRRAYEEARYEEALHFYRSALSSDYTPWPRPSKQEQQLLLSNMVACRLKLGGAAQAEVAVEDAKKCIELNPSWSKGHVRLASAYIALGREHSNDACNALQTALRLDPGNKIAREMLIKELRRDHAAAAAAAPAASSTPRDPPHNPNYVDTTGATTATGGGSAASAIPTTTSSSFFSGLSGRSRDRDDVGRSNHSSGTATPWSFRRSNPQNSSAASSSSQPSAPSNVDDTIDDHVSFREQVQYYWNEVMTWYTGQSNERKNLFRIGGIILFLYVAFGGRFGLDGLWPSNDMRSTSYRSSPMEGSSSAYHRGNYGADNAYEQFRRQRRQQQQQQHYSYQDSSSNNNYHHHNGQAGGSYYDSFTSSYGSTGLDGGGSLISILVILGVAYVCRLNGINPFHALWMMNLLGGGRRRFGGGGFWAFHGGIPGGGMMGGGIPGYNRGYRRNGPPRGW